MDREFLRPNLCLSSGGLQFLASSSLIAIVTCLSAGQAQAQSCGNITPGNYTAPIRCTLASGNGDITLTPTTTVTLPAGGTVVNVNTSNGNATIHVSGTTIVNTNGTLTTPMYTIQTVKSGTGDSIITMTGTNSMTIGTVGQPNFSGVIYALNSGTSGDAIVNVSGNLTATNNIANSKSGHGITAYGFGNSAQVIHQGSGTITVHGGAGIYVLNGSAATSVTANIGPNVTVVVDNSIQGPNFAGVGITTVSQDGLNTLLNAGTVQTLGNGVNGLNARATGTGNIILNNTGPVTTGVGSATGDASRGINASSTSGTIALTNSGAVSTKGINAFGISTTAVSGAVSITNSASVITAGASSPAIYSKETSGGATISNSGPIQTFGSKSVGILGTSVDGAITVSNSGVVTTQGAQAHGIQSTATGLGVTTVETQAAVTASGELAAGIYARGQTSSVTVAAGTAVMGGWQADTVGLGTGLVEQNEPPLTSQPPPNIDPAEIPDAPASAPILVAVGAGSIPSAGVAIGSNANGSTLTNNGTIGALSDRAVAELDRYGLGVASPLMIVNNGNITGFVELGAGDAIFRNLTPTSFDIRHFADTNGDGIRDTKRVAISDFGAGNDQFLNEANGVVRLAPVAGAATTDPTGYYLPTTGIDSRPLEMSFYDFNREGLLQGQLVNLETFDNSGIIDLRGSATGNTLVITGNPAAGGAPGSGMFIANGGQLLLTTRLNDGIPLGGQTNSFSDMLVVDQTQLGAGGPTAIAITLDPASAGALTPGNGIEVVEVRNKDASAPGVFALGARAASGAYEYTLYRNGVGGDVADGNWYLRSALIPPPPPGPTPPPIPDYRNEVPVDIVLPALANRLGLGTLGTYHDRIGDDYPEPVQPTEPIICKAPSKDGGCAVPAAVAAEMSPYRAAWGRLFGETGSVEFDATNPAGAVQNIVEHGPSYDFDMYGLQAGMDLLRRLNDDGSRDIAGFYVGVGRIDADVDAVLGGPAGTSSVNGYSLGGYWTRIAEKGWYVDAVLQATWYDAEGDAQGRGPFSGENFGTDGWGFAASLESGYPFDLGNGWSVEPQAQLVYQHVSLDDGTDAFGRIDYDASDALYGRLGARLTRDWLTQSGKRMTAWGRADVWSGFGASATTTFSGLAGGNPVSFDTDIGGTWGSVGLGLQGEVSKTLTMFASGDYNFGLGGDGNFDSWSGRIGMKVKW